MAVAVVDADGDQAERRTQLLVEVCALVGRTVVGDLHDVDRPDRSRRLQDVLLGLSEIAEEERAQPGRRRADDQAARIAAQLRSARLGGRRPDDLPGRAAQHSGHARPPGLEGDAGRSEPFEVAVVGRTVRLPDDRPVGAPEHRLDPARMVGVEVGEQDPVETVDTERLQAARERFRLAPHVDECDVVAVPQQERVALSDIAGRDTPIHRPAHRATDFEAAQCTGVHRRTADQGDRHRRREHPGQTTADRQERDRREGERAQQYAEKAVRPGQGGTGQLRREPGDQRDPSRRQPGDPDHELSERGSPGQEQARDATEHGRDRSRRLGHEVGQDAVQRKRGRQQDEHRLTGELRRQRNRKREGDAAWQPPRQSGRQRAREHQQSRRRQGGQCEAVVAGEPRIVHEQHHDGQRQGRQPIDDTAASQPHEDDRRHRRSAEHAGPRTHEGHERREGDGSRDDARPTAQADASREQEHESGDERAVRSGHRREMAERRDLHRLVEAGAHSRLVADGETGQQVAAVARRRGGGPGERVAHGGRPGEPERRLVADDGRLGRANPVRGSLPRLVTEYGHLRRDDGAERVGAHRPGITRRDDRHGHAATDDSMRAGFPRRERSRAHRVERHGRATQPPVLDAVETRGRPLGRALDPHRDLHTTLLLRCALEHRVRPLRRLCADRGRPERHRSESDSRGGEAAGPRAPKRMSRRRTGRPSPFSQRGHDQTRRRQQTGAHRHGRHRAARADPDSAADPQGDGGDDEPEVGHQTVTRSFSASNSFSPTPDTLRRSVTAAKPPCASRHSMMR